MSTSSLNHTHLRPCIGSFSRALHCLLERICPTDDGVNPAQLCNKLPFCKFQLFCYTLKFAGTLSTYISSIQLFGALPDHDLPCFYFFQSLTPTPSSCAQITHIEQFGGIIPHFFFTSIPRLSNRAFILRNFLPEFLLGLCCRSACPDCICYALHLSQLSVLPSKCVYMFCVTLKVNSYYFCKQH